MIRRLLAIAVLLPSFAWATCPLTDAYSTAVCADSPIHYYRMDASSGTTETDTTGSSNLTYSGTFTLNVTGALTGAGITDTAASFDGTTGKAQGSPDTSAPSATNGQGWTVEAWGNAAATGNKIFLTLANDAWDIETRTADSSFSFYSTQGNCSSVYGGPVKIVTYSPSNWYHLVVTTLGGGSSLQHILGYGSGSLVTTYTSFTGSGPCTSGANFVIANLNSNFFNGAADEVALYSSELSAARITAHYNAGIVAASKGWPFPVRYFQNTHRNALLHDIAFEPFTMPSATLDAPGFIVDRLNRRAHRSREVYAQ